MCLKCVKKLHTLYAVFLAHGNGSILITVLERSLTFSKSSKEISGCIDVSFLDFNTLEQGCFPQVISFCIMCHNFNTEDMCCCDIN